MGRSVTRTDQTHAARVTPNSSGPFELSKVSSTLIRSQSSFGFLLVVFEFKDGYYPSLSPAWRHLTVHIGASTAGRA